MESAEQLTFGSFRLDPRGQQLWRGEEVLELQARPFAVLQYLVNHQGQVVSKEELFAAVWGETHVSKAVLKVAVRSIREALGEQANDPRYIETIGRTGYRFIGGAEPDRVSSHASEHEVGRRPWIVGREAELASLQSWLAQALEGERQLVFVTGEPGVGKSTLVDLFRQHMQSPEQTVIGYGQCVEQYGEGEPYLPVLEALSRLCRQVEGKALGALLRQYAPTWAVSMPDVLEASEQDTLLTQVQGATRERMLRELADVIEISSAQRPLLLVLEDLHWSDYSTLELLSYLAQRRERARLMILGTYRPEEVMLREHPLQGVRQELQARRCCRELAVELLTKPEVEAYLTKRFANRPFIDDLASTVHARTGGNALFMANFVDALVAQRVVLHEGEQWRLTADVQSVGIPDSVEQLIRRQVERLFEEEQRLLESASVAGTEFDVATLAAALPQDLDHIEEACENLAWQGLFLEEVGVTEWSDGTVSGRYRFRHIIYQQVIYNRISAARKIRLHRLIGQRMEQGYAERTDEIAAELAVHFEQGRDYVRALRYLQRAGQLAFQRNAHLEATGYAKRGLTLLEQLPAEAERISHEIGFLMTLGPALTQKLGLANSEVEQVYARALTLCQQVGETTQLFPVLVGLFIFYMGRADFTTATGLVHQLGRLAERHPEADMRVEALVCMGCNEFFCGDLTSARRAFEQCVDVYDLKRHRSHILWFAYDPGVMGHSVLAGVECYLGYPDRALRHCAQARELADALKHPPSLAQANHFTALTHWLRGEYAVVQGLAETQIKHAQEQSFPFWQSMGEMFLGAALAAQGQALRGVPLIRRGLDQLATTGMKSSIAFWFSLLIESLLSAEDVDGATEALQELAERNNPGEEPFFEAEVQRLWGEVTMRRSSLRGQDQATAVAAEAEAYFLQALAVARREHVKSLELRAAIGLSQLWQQQNRIAEAYALLSEVYDWFTEGFETRALTQARMLLQVLGDGPKD